jgi:hypothetical protein
VVKESYQTVYELLEIKKVFHAFNMKLFVVHLNGEIISHDVQRSEFYNNGFISVLTVTFPNWKICQIIAENVLRVYNCLLFRITILGVLVHVQKVISHTTIRNKLNAHNMLMLPTT